MHPPVSFLGLITCRDIHDRHLVICLSQLEG